MKVYISLLILFLSAPVQAETVGTFYGQTLVKPLGYLSSRRPPAGARVVSLDDIKVEFHARQVCGYTDWSTAVISLPRQILSADYWRGVGNNIKKKAVDSVLAISGALPSMLACNASPTFCAVLNRAEALAQANIKFTFDSCQILEGLSDTTKSHFESLRSCVDHKVNDAGETASTALDSCTVGNNDPEAMKSKDKIRQAEKNTKRTYKSEDLTRRLCHEQTFPRFRSSKNAYTVSAYSCRWLKEVFPGISVEAGGKVRHGGTFSNAPGEEMYDGYAGKTASYLVELLELMHAIRYGKASYVNDGPKPRNLVVAHPDVRRKLAERPNGKLKGVCYEEDGSTCENNVEALPPVYRLSSGSSLPALLVSPATLYEIIELIPAGSTPQAEYARENSRLALALEPLVQSVSFVRSQDIIQDSLSRLRRSCRDPDMQSQAAQDDCRFRREGLEQAEHQLQAKSESDRKHLLAQMQFYEEVERMRLSQTRLSRATESLGKDPIIQPSEVQ